MTVADLIGIKVVVASTIGGVNIDYKDTLDMSSDIEALSDSGLLVISSGLLPCFDLKKTLEVCETNGVAVAGFKSDFFSYFYSQDNVVKVDYRLETPQAIALAYNVKQELGIKSAVFVINPVSSEYEIEKDKLEDAVKQSDSEARNKKLSGRQYNDFMFKRVRELTNGASKNTFIYNLNNDALLAAWVAFAMYKDKNTTNNNIGISKNIRRIGGNAATSKDMADEAKSNAKKGMDFYLWLFAVKQFAQTYDASKMIYNNLSPEMQEKLKEEYNKTIR